MPGGDREEADEDEDEEVRTGAGGGGVGDLEEMVEELVEAREDEVEEDEEEAGVLMAGLGFLDCGVSVLPLVSLFRFGVTDEAGGAEATELLFALFADESAFEADEAETGGGSRGDEDNGVGEVTEDEDKAADVAMDVVVDGGVLTGMILAFT